jgi:hypothetical protein
LLSDFLLQRLQCPQDQLPSELLFFFWRQFGISRRADDAAGGDGSQRADFFGDGDHRADLRHRDFQLFYFLADRCAAASAGASSRGEDHAGDAGGFELIGDLAADLHGVLHRCMGAAGGADEFMKLGKFPFML